MQKFLKRAWAEIDLSSLKHNYEEIKKLVGKKEVLAVVKANAYGHDDKAVCNKLQQLGVRYFGVSNLWEAEKLRDCGITGSILIFGYTDKDYFDDIIRYNITQTVGSVEYARQLSEFAIKTDRQITVHIKINTGMTRVGIDTIKEMEDILSLPNLICEGIYTHFAVSDSLEPDNIYYTDNQQKRLLEFAKGRGLLVHSQNSGGILYHQNYDADMVRAGIILYGHMPSYDVEVPVKLKPVMTLKSVVTQLKTVPAGIDIGYGRACTSDKEIKTAVIPVGYADGYPRSLSNKGFFAVNGVLVPILGRVCMDQVVVDVTDVPDVKTGDIVLVYSDKFCETGIDYNANQLNTIGYELTCNVALRIPRVIVEEGKIVDVVRYGLI